MTNKPELFKQREISFTYTNWEGKTRKRRVVPIGVEFCSSEYHKEPQWILRAFDVERDGVPIRGFAMKDIEGFNVD